MDENDELKKMMKNQQDQVNQSSYGGITGMNLS